LKLGQAIEYTARTYTIWVLDLGFGIGDMGGWPLLVCLGGLVALSDLWEWVYGYILPMFRAEKAL